MDGGKERYYDFSEDSELLRQFDPDLTSDVTLKYYAQLLTNYLALRNPVNRITGLIAHHSAISSGFSISIHRILRYIMWLMVANTVLIGYIAYQVV